MLIEIVFYVSLSLSVNSQLMLFSCNSLLSFLSIPGDLVEFLRLIVLDLFVFDVLVFYYNFVASFNNVCYSCGD